MHPRLKAFVEVAPFLAKAMREDAAVGVTDTEKFIAYVPGKTIDVGVKIGMPVGDDAISTAMKENRTISTFVPAEVYGIPFMATGAPIHDEAGNVIGGFGYAINVTQQAEMEGKLKNMSNELAAAMQEMSASIQQVNSNTDRLSEYFSEMVTKSKSTTELLNNIDEILNFIQDVGNKTNLLGLNAAIEAARAGEAGRSFKVVADEIRNLAMRSKQSVENITSYLKRIHQEFEEIANSIQANERYIQEQSGAMEEITASIEEINSMTDELRQLADKILQG
ncbi:hypothetical protein BBF96_04800 [Anoxybacter fermentans]|uniref:Methyl-accepting transducer domain-containing protein n=1 Tax=Anoxybacter fermentans TaxID=1323375 RepID=A0A3Q9HPI9_9FIRM|nr:methyl-accepting chemotaxis protein [Anoxybacter fermentans]AZR72770.1 hypothetical protein BBF96_04800 [Anoxybacter fermentans]